MNYRFSHLAIITAAALAFSGCEWGGAHDDTWNDGYSWANFTGTYRFVKAVVYSSASSESESESSETTETAKKIINGSANAKMSSASEAGGTVKAGEGIVEGSFQAKVNGKSITDDKAGNLVYNGAAVGSIAYSSGSWHFKSINLNANAGDNVAITYKYYDAAGAGGGSGGGSGPYQNATSLSYLKVTQQGNRLTMTGDKGITYTGRITGSNVGRDDYQAARTIYVSFETASSDGKRKITGNFSGVWSGATDKSYGVLSERQIHGTHSQAGNFVGVAADTTIKVPEITVSE